MYYIKKSDVKVSENFVFISVISLLNMLTPGMRPACVSVCVSVCMCVTAFCIHTVQPISMKVHTNDFN